MFQSPSRARIARRGLHPGDSCEHAEIKQRPDSAEVITRRPHAVILKVHHCSTATQNDPDWVLLTM